MAVAQEDHNCLIPAIGDSSDGDDAVAAAAAVAVAAVAAVATAGRPLLGKQGASRC